MKIRKNSAWRDKALRTTESAPIIDWLRDRGSLTARLQTKGSFAVRLLRQELAKPTNDEIQALGLTRTCKVRVREVALMCDGEALVFAHTALSSKPRGAMSLWFARLGTRSLGALLFAHAGFIRGTINCKRIDHRHALFGPAINALHLAAAPPSALWARRSLFTYGKQSVLVTEVYSPQISTQ